MTSCENLLGKQDSLPASHTPSTESCGFQYSQTCRTFQLSLMSNAGQPLFVEKTSLREVLGIEGPTTTTLLNWEAAESRYRNHVTVGCNVSFIGTAGWRATQICGQIRSLRRPSQSSVQPHTHAPLSSQKEAWVAPLGSPSQSHH